MIQPASIAIENFQYDLPAHRIAHEPLQERDASKLLIYQKGDITEGVYSNISNYLPENSLLVFNNTRVINARIIFQKSTGANIEIFCLEPVDAAKGYDVAMIQRGNATWKCLVGGIAKWKEPVLSKKIQTDGEEIILNAQLHSREQEACSIGFSWSPERFTFAEVLVFAGYVPLPPYIKRSTVPSDKERYQTAYAQHEGSVAAPTAGLHFTESLLQKIRNKNIETGFLTLHVGAGTFKPVSVKLIGNHEMHGEWLLVNRQMIEQLQNNQFIIAVGTTSLRTMETLYWLGVKIHLKLEDPLSLQQWEVYQEPLCNTNLTMHDSMKHLLLYMDEHQLHHIYSQTHILIAPGYTMRSAKALITNFHQPQSTLLLLVAAAIGEDWKNVYQYALDNHFRFLSYGDGSLLFFN